MCANGCACATRGYACVLEAVPICALASGYVAVHMYWWLFIYACDNTHVLVTMPLYWWWPGSAVACLASLDHLRGLNGDQG